MKKPDHFANPRVGSAAVDATVDRILPPAEIAAARAEIAGWPGYRQTPLVALPNLARALGLGALWYKDEDKRFGLKSFKALGGAYAVLRLLKREIGAKLGTEPSSAALLDRRHPDLARAITVTSATDGNHGRSVAWGAQMFGCPCVIYVHETVSQGRVDAIARYGAEVRRVPGNYDDAVREAARAAAANGWHVISDTSYEGYTDVPRDVMIGYGTMIAEAVDQLPDGARPTHCFIQAGVGALAAATSAVLWQAFGAARPRLIVVEPDKAACLYASARAGKPQVVTGDLDTVMAGLACGEVSILAWEVLDRAAADFLAVDDGWALAAVRRLANHEAGDPPVVAGETGAAGLAGLMAALADPGLKAALGLGPTSSVLLFGSEGDTDPAIYQEIVGRSAADVLAS